ncbi:hypothetical protein [Peptoniphilus asaccharolyticus]|nr:hypothetical protein [Peptoniphilus asaccharolyticus]MBL7576472.1 hypothetical protein [Peptoniphilus asaccharolyticus]
MVSEELIPQSELINLKSIEILKAMFEVKDVPLSLLLQIDELSNQMQHLW